MSTIRMPAVAGRFYPADSDRLRAELQRLLSEAQSSTAPGVPKALIVPHAGYVFSGPVAASAFARLEEHRSAMDRVVLLGTAHSKVEGLAASSAEGFATPIGWAPLDQEALSKVLDLPQVQIDDQAHAQDHSLEVQLPFLQVALEDFKIVPFLVGRSNADDVAEVLERLWNGPTTLIVVSSDLSHYLDYDAVLERDRATAQAIEQLRPKDLGSGQACGRHAIAGLLQSAGRHGLRARTLDLRNSADTGGPRDRVVGYGAFMFESL